MKLVLIAAVSRNSDGNLVIGNNGKIPWFENDEIRKQDLTHFKSLTLYRPLIMGSKTFESLGNKPLQKRTNIVVSSKHELDINSGTVYHAFNLLESISMASQFGEEAYAIGGGEIYKGLLPLAERLEITEIHKEYSGDAYFPQIKDRYWKEKARERREFFDFVTYERR